MVETFMKHKKLHQLQKQLMDEYLSYKAGKISEKEYLTRAKPLDMAIGNLEMATLRGTPALRGSSLPHTHMQGN